MKHSSLVMLFFLLASGSVSLADRSQLCDKVFENQISFSDQLEPRDSDEITLITWNSYKFSKNNFMSDLLSLSKESDVLMLQEAMHSTQLQNYLTAEYPFSFSFYKSFCDSEKKATGVMSASRYQLSSNITLVSPDTEPFTHTPKVSGYSVINVPEIGPIHLINTHALNFNTGSKFNRQIDQLAEFIKKLDGPVIWAGDFNTWSAGRQSYLDEAAADLGLQHLKPSDDERYLVLDHVYVKGLEVLEVKMLNNIKSSDHTPIKVVFRKK